MDSMPKISIIMPTFNRADKIQTAVRSVICQSYRDWELIIIDDASTDKTSQVLKNIKASDSRIICLGNEINCGLAKTLNRGLIIAKGEHICRIDDDDEWIDYNKLQKQIDYINAHSECILVGTAFQVIDKNKSIMRIFSAPLEDKEIRSVILSVNPFGHSTVLFKRNIALIVGGYDESMCRAVDHDLWLRLGQKGKLANISDITMKYTEQTGSISYRNRDKQLKYQYEILRKYGHSYPRALWGWLRFMCSFVLYYLPVLRFFKKYIR
jgi:glycosyltransferase involved in cell wall biosynthesis